MRRLIFTACATLLLAACSSSNNNSSPVDAGSDAGTDAGVDAGPDAGTDGGNGLQADGGPDLDDGGCYAHPSPTSSFEIINACTDAGYVDKHPVLPLLLPDGGLPPLP